MRPLVGRRLLRPTPWAAVAFVAAWLFAQVGEATAQQSSALFLAFEEITRGLDDEARFSSFAQAPSDPDVAYLGTDAGIIYTSRDGGESWVPQRTSYDGGQAGFAGNAHRLESRRLWQSSETPEGLDVPSPSTVLNFSNIYDPSLYFDRLPTSLDTLSAPDLIRSRFDSITEQSPRAPMVLTAPEFAHELRFREGRFSVADGRRTRGVVGHHNAVLGAARGATAINWLAVHPRDAGIALAATNDGVYRTHDHGHTWVLIYWSPDRDRAYCRHIAWSIHDETRIVLSTRGGVFFSHDDAATFAPAPDARFSQSNVGWVAFDPSDEDREVYAMGIARERSVRANTDSFLYWAPLRLRAIREIVFDPTDPATILISSEDGLWFSNDRGVTVQRAGESTFAGVPVRAISVAPAGGHFLAATATDVWESRDRGRTWQSVRYGGYDGDITRVAFDLHDASVAWIIGAQRVVRYRDTDPRQMSESAGRAYLSWLASEPTLSEAISAALEHVHQEQSDIDRFARRAHASTWMPEVHAGLAFRTTTADADISARAFGLTNGDLIEGFRNDYERPRQRWAVTAVWDVQRIVSGRDARSVQRWRGAVHAVELQLTERVSRLYAERARLMLQELLEEREDPRASMMRSLRVRELSAHLHHLTDGLVRRPISPEDRN